MRLLIVENDEHIVPYMKSTLEGEGFEVDFAADGTAGLALALTDRYDVIAIGGTMLPGMSGCEVCREIRQAGLEAPVLMLMTKNGEYNEVDALSVGANDFLSKPFSFTVLVARIKALKRGEVLSAAGIELNMENRSAMRNGTPIELAPLEATLLEYLMRNAGKAVSKASILEHMRRNGCEGGNKNNVEVYIGYLRKKVDVPFGRKSIRTVRGIGYKFEDENAR